ncbi:MAG TPA: hypothetical protein VFA15_09210, partial [Nitrososphaera sp.]|nr:hypothetical protein [Nitrososphaera sp.]
MVRANSGVLSLDVCPILHLVRHSGFKPMIGGQDLKHPVSGRALFGSGPRQSRTTKISDMRENPLANALHQVFVNSPNYARLLARTARGRTAGAGAAGNELNLAGLTDSAKSLVLSVLQHEIRRPLFLIVPDNHAGAFYHQEYNNLSRYPVYLYPASEVSPYEQVLSSPDNVASQLEVLEHILSKPVEPYVVLVSARSLMQRVLSADVLTSNTLVLKKGDAFDTKDLALALSRLGYARESLVTLRGE